MDVDRSGLGWRYDSNRLTELETRPTPLPRPTSREDVVRTRRFPVDPIGIPSPVEGSVAVVAVAAALIERRRYAKSSLSPRFDDECSFASDARSSGSEPELTRLSSSIVVASGVVLDTGAMVGLVGAYPDA